ncbi:MAG: diguanylate cyclase domain-containing protein [Lachnospiraceae bacterium]
MKINNIEIIQAAIETIGALFCLMIMFYMAVNKMTKKIRHLIVMYGICVILFLMDACAYIFRGNTDSFSLFMTRFSNNSIFLLNVLLAVFFLNYFKNTIKNCGITIPKLPYRATLFFYLLAGACVIINFFNGWMFYFDTNNYYHRNIGWYIYSSFFVVGMAILIGTLLSIRTKLDMRLLIVLISYLLAPFLAIILQIFLYGISISNIGVAITLTLVLLFYLKHQEEEKRKLKISYTKERNMISTMIMITLMIICMSASIIICVIHIQKIAHENSIKDSQNVAQLVRSDIENVFLSCLTSSEIITSDYRIIELLQKSSRETAKDDEEYMSEYLSCIKEQFDYQMVFIVSEKSGAYYTYDGISKYIDVANDSHDIWYKNFKNNSKDYLLDIDTDEANNGKLTVFVNHAIYDKQGNFLGVGGVGINITKLQKIIADYESKYSLNINLINYDGLIQVNSDSMHIEKDYLDNSYLRSLRNGDFLYDEQTDLCRITCYIENLDWYLVINDYQTDRVSIQRIILPCLGVFIIGMLIMGVIFLILTRREYESSEKLLEKTIISLTDELTGLKNRRAYTELLDKIHTNELFDDIAVVMMDVNGLKKVNDCIGHDAGDELLIGTAECICEAFEHLGDVFRIGGDEFIAILNCSRETAQDAVNSLDIISKKWKSKFINGISISKGIVFGCEHPKMTIYEMKDLADKLMYEDKEEYYRRTNSHR